MAYFAAEALNLSAILAVFFCGIAMSHYTWHSLSPAAKVRRWHAPRTWHMDLTHPLPNSLQLSGGKAGASLPAPGVQDRTGRGPLLHAMHARACVRAHARIMSCHGTRCAAATSVRCLRPC